MFATFIFAFLAALACFASAALSGWPGWIVTVMVFAYVLFDHVAKMFGAVFVCWLPGANERNPEWATMGSALGSSSLTMLLAVITAPALIEQWRWQFTVVFSLFAVCLVTYLVTNYARTYRSSRRSNSF